MSQHDFNIANQSFPATRTDLNNALQALASNSSGDAEPSTTFANQWWYETDTNTLKLRNEANNAWLSFATVDQSTAAWTLAHSINISSNSSVAPVVFTITDTDNAVASDQVLGGINFETSDTTNAGVSAQIEAVYENASGATAIDFRTGYAGALVDTMHLDFVGRVGIGTVLPSSVLHLKAIDPTLIIEDSNNGTGGTSYRPHTEFWASGTRVGSVGMTTSNDLEIIADNYNSASINFDTGGTERLRIDSSGHLIAPYGITLGTAVGVYDASKTLDDYEEGTWTPVIADASSGGNVGSATFTHANYTKVGNKVTLAAQMLNIVTTGMTAANALYVRGLPFLSATQIAYGACWPSNINFQSTRTGVSAQISVSDTWATFQQYGSGTTATPIDVSDITSGTSDINFSITYFANA